jgi:hypothetical protein
MDKMASYKTSQNSSHGGYRADRNEAAASQDFVPAAHHFHTMSTCQASLFLKHLISGVAKAFSQTLYYLGNLAV